MPEPYTYTDPDGDTLSIRQAISIDRTVPLLSIRARERGSAAGVMIPFADVDAVVAAIRTAAGQPHDRVALRRHLAEAIRDAACPGDCDKTEAECVKERIQPAVWHHGRLTVVEGEPEMFADVALAVLPEPTDGATVLDEAADRLEERTPDSSEDFMEGVDWALSGLRRLADEAQQPGVRCDVTFVGGGQCDKPAGHRPPGSQDPHVPDARRERYAAAIDAASGWVLDGGQHMIDAVMAVADEEQRTMLPTAKAALEAWKGETERLREERQIERSEFSDYARQKELQRNEDAGRIATLRAENERLRAELEQARATTPGNA
ncbi:hypothetical protein [Streptomyces sp. NPDC055036]